MYTALQCKELITQPIIWLHSACRSLSLPFFLLSKLVHRMEKTASQDRQYPSGLQDVTFTSYEILLPLRITVVQFSVNWTSNIRKKIYNPVIDPALTTTVSIAVILMFEYTHMKGFSWLQYNLIEPGLIYSLITLTKCLWLNSGWMENTTYQGYSSVSTRLFATKVDIT